MGGRAGGWPGWGGPIGRQPRAHAAAALPAPRAARQRVGARARNSRRRAGTRQRAVQPTVRPRRPAQPVGGVPARRRPAGGRAGAAASQPLRQSGRRDSVRCGCAGVRFSLAREGRYHGGIAAKGATPARGPVDHQVQAALVPRPHSRRGGPRQQLLWGDLALRANGLASNADPCALHDFGPARQEARARARQSVVTERVDSAATAVRPCAPAPVWSERQGQAESAPQGDLHGRRRECQTWLGGDRREPSCRLLAGLGAQQGLAAGGQGGQQHAVAAVEVASLRREPLPAIRSGFVLVRRVWAGATSQCGPGRAVGPSLSLESGFGVRGTAHARRGAGQGLLQGRPAGLCGFGAAGLDDAQGIGPPGPVCGQRSTGRGRKPSPPSAAGRNANARASRSRFWGAPPKQRISVSHNATSCATA